MRLYSFTISVRLSPKDRERYLRLLKRFGLGIHPAKRSESFRALLQKIDFSYETNMDNEDWDWDTEQPHGEE